MKIPCKGYMLGEVSFFLARWELQAYLLIVMG